MAYRPLAPILAALDKRWLAPVAIAAAFATYFCMYAFRRPFAAVSYDELKPAFGAMEPKTLFAIAQVFGYALSKFIGIKVVPETGRSDRARRILFLILAAEFALFLFAILPAPAKPFALFLNGLPLGMIWGLVVWYLEGRRSSDLLLAGLSCSFIVSSGVVKDAGLAVRASFDLSDVWMPVVTGALFLLPLMLCLWILDQLPEPDAEDRALRTERRPMDASARKAFLLRFWPGLALLLGAYFVLTAYRDFRDIFGVEMLSELGINEPGIFTRTEIPVGFAVLAGLALLSLVRSNRLALLISQIFIGLGFVLTALATLALEAGHIDGRLWMILIGIGLYLAYVPYNSLLFDRLIAATRTTGTAVFAIYIADSLGYVGSVSLQVWKDFIAAKSSRLEFFLAFTPWMAAFGALSLFASALWFDRAARRAAQAP